MGRQVLAPRGCLREANWPTDHLLLSRVEANSNIERMAGSRFPFLSHELGSGKQRLLCGLVTIVLRHHHKITSHTRACRALPSTNVPFTMR